MNDEYAGRQDARLTIPRMQSGDGRPGFRGHTCAEFVERFIKSITLGGGVLDGYGASTSEDA